MTKKISFNIPLLAGGEINNLLKLNKLKQQTITPLLIQLEYINKWDGKLPVYGQVPQMFKNIQ